MTRNNAKPQNKNTEAGFVPIRRGIYEHLENGKMTGEEWMFYSILHLKADHRTGVCYKISAPVLVEILQFKKGVRIANRILSRLEKKGYIRRINHRGKVLFYPIIINKYMTSFCLLIDAHNPLIIKAVKDYTKGALSFNCLLSVLSTIIKEVKNTTGTTKGRKTTPKGFTPPTVDQVKEYAATVKYPDIDAERFVEWYEAAGWKGSDGKPMRSWKQTIISWRTRDRKKEQAKDKPAKDERLDFLKVRMPTPEEEKMVEDMDMPEKGYR